MIAPNDKQGPKSGLSVVIVFALVADGEDGDGFVVFDFEQGHITCGADWDQHFTQEGVVGDGFAAAESEFMQRGNRDKPRLHD